MRRFLQGEMTGGILLLVATLTALIWANSPAAESYTRFWHAQLPLSGLPAIDLSLQHWIKDGLMAFFFLLLGLEVKYAFLLGALTSPRRAALPIVGALGGAVVPALVYFVLNAGGEGAHGWGIPMATDPVFVLALIAMLGRRVPPALVAFFVTLAVVDYVASALIIAVFYTASLNLAAFAIAGGLCLLLAIANRAGARHPLIYAALGVLLWLAVLQSGIHATIAGVLVALAIPAHPNPGAEPSAETHSPLHRVEHALGPWVNFVIVPLFALANAGVAIGGDLVATHGERVTLAVLAGLVIGKPVGILLGCVVAIRAGLADRPLGTTWRQLSGVAVLGGIGFTVALFISELAFDAPTLVENAKMGILAGSLLAGIVGYGLLRTGPLATADRP